ncbi:MAG TPA: hypothetical protein DEG96_09885 [Candidatus Atribacteria bacterium]|uniref:Uncharacterized protein n=1 Tax=candidate division TA06 bacterium 34_109 TaxID=1635277 RepID=A0A124G026_UNCT6|nr:MAG: Uncharacterized protein XE03_1679 [candidate division TA06 bacterium 34_109]HBY58143.1 hypothetical protein [Candidatus Atribacteria bacterium]
MEIENKISDLKINFKKATKLPPKILIKKVYRKIDNKIYYFIRAKKITKNPIDIDSNIFENFEPNINSLLNINNKREHYIQELKNSGKEGQIIKQADRICNHIFNLLGSGDINLGKDIQWNEDFKTGFIWENKFYKNIKTVNLQNDADVKVPWELSRFQHIPTLGQAYLLTNNVKYALEFKNQIENWISKNPIEMSVNWTCTMEVAIRACNWIIGYYFFKDYLKNQKKNKINQEFWIEYHKALYLHGKFIFDNLENTSHYNSNHYLSDLAGLIWLGLYFKNFKYDQEDAQNNPKIWLDFGLKEFEQEMNNQINSDGVDYEASTAYHCLVTELFLFTSILCSKNNIAFTKEYKDKLEKMIEFIMDITKPDGHIPLIGDMDSGRFIILSDYGDLDKRDFRHLVALGGEYFKRNDFKYYSPNHNCPVSLWCFGKTPQIKIKTNEKPNLNLASKAYKDSGYYILRNDKIYIIIKCGPNGMNGNGGHTHNDQLSFELNISGIDFVIDPGTYVYTADYRLRNLFRSTSMHNTLQVANLEQNNFEEKELFGINNETNAQLLDFNYNYFKGRHYGFMEKAGIIAEREVKLEDNKIIINDFIIKIPGSLDYKKYMRFHLDREVKIEPQADCLILTNLTNEKIKLKLFNLQKSEYNIEKSWMAKEYGLREETRVINCEIKDSVINTIIEII